MLVKATNQYEKLNVEDKELKRIPKKGETFEVTEERYKVLSGENKWKVAFAEEIKTTEIETATKKVKAEKAVKKTTRKTTKKDK